MGTLGRNEATSLFSLDHFTFSSTAQKTFSKILVFLAETPMTKQNEKYF